MKKKNLNKNNGQNAIDEEDVDDISILSENDERRDFHLNKNEVRLSVKRNWKGLEGVGKELETPKNYWTKMKKYFA